MIGDGARRLGVLTDLGVSTAHVEASLSGCDALVLECNHDLELLESGDYPYPLKQRIAGRLGHLHNEAAAEILARIDTSRLTHIVAAHLSQQNNTPDLARAALAAALGLRAGLDRHRRAGDRVRLARALINTNPAFPRDACGVGHRGERDGKAAGALQGEGQDRLRDGRPALPGHALPRRRLGVRRREAREASAEGRNQQPDQRLRDGAARRCGYRDALRPPAERARVAGQGDEDDPGRVRRAQRMRGLDGQAVRYRRGHEARRADLRILPQERRAARPALQRRPHPRAGLGHRRRDRRR